MLEFDPATYRLSSLVESMHSILRRLMRGDVLARTRAGQHAELGVENRR